MCPVGASPCVPRSVSAPNFQNASGRFSYTRRIIPESFYIITDLHANDFPDRRRRSVSKAFWFGVSRGRAKHPTTGRRCTLCSGRTTRRSPTTIEFSSPSIFLICDKVIFFRRDRSKTGMDLNPRHEWTEPRERRGMHRMAVVDSASHSWTPSQLTWITAN